MFFLSQGIDHCPDISIANVTTTDQVDHSSHPILFHLNRDPGERYPMKAHTQEYKDQVFQVLTEPPGFKIQFSINQVKYILIDSF